MCIPCSLVTKIVSFVVSLPHLLLFASLLLITYTSQRLLSNIILAIDSFSIFLNQILISLIIVVQEHLVFISTFKYSKDGHVRFQNKIAGPFLILYIFGMLLLFYADFTNLSQFTGLSRN